MPTPRIVSRHEMWRVRPVPEYVSYTRGGCGRADRRWARRCAPCPPLYSRQSHDRGDAEEPVSDLAITFDVPAWRRRLRVAQGQEPADLVLTGGEIVDVFGGDTFQADVAIVDGVIAGVGSYP